MKGSKHKIRDLVFLKLFFGSKSFKVTDEEFEYFRKHPDEIDDFSAPLTIHKFYLLIGSLSGILLLGLSKLIKFSSLLSFLSIPVTEFLIDIVFEIGVALIGASITAYILGILLNKQKSNARRWRTELRKRINQSDEIQKP